MERKSIKKDIKAPEQTDHPATRQLPPCPCNTNCLCPVFPHSWTLPHKWGHFRNLKCLNHGIFLKGNCPDRTMHQVAEKSNIQSDISTSFHSLKVGFYHLLTQYKIHGLWDKTMFLYFLNMIELFNTGLWYCMRLW